jgi:hypothetical protein
MEVAFSGQLTQSILTYSMRIRVGETKDTKVRTCDVQGDQRTSFERNKSEESNHWRDQGTGGQMK